MSPRSYDRRLRVAAAGEARRRIVAAAAELHAERGPAATNHASIAERAGVSIPTVYKHFPTPDAVLPACTALAAEHAPALDARLFDGARDAPERIRRLVDAVFRLRAYYAAWSRWIAEESAPPALRPFLARERLRLRRMVRAALPPAARGELVDLAAVLLSDASWRALKSRGPGLVAAALITLCRER